MIKKHNKEYLFGYTDGFYDGVNDGCIKMIGILKRSGLLKEE